MDFRVRVKGWSSRNLKVVGGEALRSEKGSSVIKGTEVKPFLKDAVTSEAMLVSDRRGSLSD